MIIKIGKVEDLLNAIVYYPGNGDEDWTELKNNISKSSNNKDPNCITVKDVAEYLIQNPEYKTELVNKIRQKEKKFKIRKLGFLEVCPTDKDIPGSKLFLRGGNKRSIAYAMLILKKERIFEPIKASWIPYFTREDNNNLAGLKTTPDITE